MYIFQDLFKTNGWFLISNMMNLPDTHDHKYKLEMNSDEIFRRLRWCLDNGESFWPANDNVHHAPGDDSNFYYSVPPWLPDRSPNPLGIP